MATREGDPSSLTLPPPRGRGRAGRGAETALLPQLAHALAEDFADVRDGTLAHLANSVSVDVLAEGIGGNLRREGYLGHAASVGRIAPVRLVLIVTEDDRLALNRRCALARHLL
jgi:hypothetical protein